MPDPSVIKTFLFTDIEGSSRLWEQAPDRMQPALARHDAIARGAVAEHRGAVVKSTGDGILATFDDPLDAIGAAVAMQRTLADPAATHGLALRVRTGLHVGANESRDNDFFGNAVNRAARITGAAHGGQILLSQAVKLLVADRLPAPIVVRELGAVRLRDLAEPEEVWQVVHPELAQVFPPLRDLSATPNNLPQQPTSFVGRERELREVKEALAKSRLLTLVGAGGIGKTRLSLEVAAEVLDDHPDGVWFVELAPLTDPRLVPQAVASVLGVREEPGRPVVEALLKHAGHRRGLVVLDNCEHVVDACADLAGALLQSGPTIKLIASSREPLNVRGESTYLVPALGVPDAREAPSFELPRHEAVRLFTDRARSVQASFELTRENALPVIEICRRLDGIPLAIELAAARVRALSVETIAARLSDRFALLTGGRRTDLPRQRTLRALIDWSHDLLTPSERTLFRRLAVFAGGFTLEAAESVAAGGEIGRSDVLDLLTSLVDKSLVATDAEGARYRLLDTIRVYAEERLIASGEADTIRTQGLAYYLSLAEAARAMISGPEQGAWLARLDLERENLLAAHAWADHAENGADLGLQLVLAIKHYWANRGLVGLGQRVTVEALARPDAQVRNANRCRALVTVGQLAYMMGHHDEACAWLEESLAIARETGDHERIAVVLQWLGLVCVGQQDAASGRGYLEEALALVRERGNKRDLASATNALAQLHRVEGALDDAEPLYEQALALARELDDRDSIAIGLLNLAMVSVARARPERARGMLREAAAIAEEIGSKRAGQSVLEVTAGLASSSTEWTLAARLFGAAEAEAAQTGLHRDPADEAFLAPRIAGARRALGAEAFAAADAAGRVLGYNQAMAETRSWLGGR